ncbi:MAG: hypothetical protein RLZZ136_1054, partial [Pseudomonadota bacterium]
HVQHGVALVAESGGVLGQIVTEMAKINALIDRIAGSADMESRQLISLNHDIVELEQSTQRNAAMAEESSASARSLAGHAEMLSQVVSRFRLTEQAADRRAAAPPLSATSLTPASPASSASIATVAPLTPSPRPNPLPPATQPLVITPRAAGAASQLTIKANDDWTEF